MSGRKPILLTRKLEDNTLFGAGGHGVWRCQGVGVLHIHVTTWVVGGRHWARRKETWILNVVLPLSRRVTWLWLGSGLGRWRQEHWKFKVILSYQRVKGLLSYMRLCPKKKHNNETRLGSKQFHYFNTYCLDFYLSSWYLLVGCGVSIDDVSHAIGFWRDKHYPHLRRRLSSSWAIFTKWNWDGCTKWHLSSSVWLKRNSKNT